MCNMNIILLCVAAFAFTAYGCETWDKITLQLHDYAQAQVCAHYTLHSITLNIFSK